MTDETSKDTCLSSAEENFKANAAAVADGVGDTINVFSVTKRICQAANVVFPQTDQFNNTATISTAWLGSICYLSVALSLYLDKEKYARGENRVKAKLFALAGAQCAVLSTYGPGTLALPSFIFCALADFSVAIHSMSCAYEKMNFPEWLRDSLEELSILEGLGLTEKSKSLKLVIRERYRANYNDSPEKEKMASAIAKYKHKLKSDDSLFDNIDTKSPLNQDEINKENEIKKQLKNAFHDSVFNFIARSASLIGMLLLKVLIVSAAWQPYAPLIFLGVGALMYGYRTAAKAAKPAFNAMYSRFFTPRNEPSKVDKGLSYARISP